MFGCAMTLRVRLEKKTGFVGKLSHEVVPILKRHPGAVELMVFQDDIELDKFVVVSLWQTREHAEQYRAVGYQSTTAILKPYLTFPPAVHIYRLDSTVPRTLGTLQAEEKAPDQAKSPELKIVYRR